MTPKTLDFSKAHLENVIKYASFKDMLSRTSQNNEELIQKRLYKLMLYDCGYVVHDTGLVK